MALSSKQRANLPASAYVFQKTRKYPIHDEQHARSAIQMVEAHGNEFEKRAVKAAVKKKYPDLAGRSSMIRTAKRAMKKRAG